jgi:arginase
LLDQAGVRRVETVGEMTNELQALVTLVEQIYLHVDLDVLDPAEATSNQWTPPGGINLQTLLDAIAEVRKRANLASLGIASYDPAVDQNGRALSAALDVVKVTLGNS